MSEKEILIKKLKRMGKSDLEISQLLGDYSLVKEPKFTSNQQRQTGSHASAYLSSSLCPVKREVSYVRK